MFVEQPDFTGSVKSLNSESCDYKKKLKKKDSIYTLERYMTNWLLIKKQLRNLNIEWAFNASIVNFSLNALVVVIRQFIIK